MATVPSLPLPLLVWLSPGFPVGAFAYSSGLEWAVEAGDIRDAVDLGAWLSDMVEHGAIRSDAVILAATRNAATPVAILEINALALALAPTRERHLETSTQGAAFLTAVAAAWLAPGIQSLAAALGEREVAYPVALGVAAAAHDLDPKATIEMFALSAVQNLVSAGVRLGVIGQSEAQTIIAALIPVVGRLSRRAAAAGLDDLGTCAWQADIASMRHETQYSRLFRS